MPPTSDEHSRAISNLLELYPDRWSDETLELALNGTVAVDWGDLEHSLDKIERVVAIVVS